MGDLLYEASAGTAVASEALVTLSTSVYNAERTQKTLNAQNSL